MKIFGQETQNKKLDSYRQILHQTFTSKFDNLFPAKEVF